MIKGGIEVICGCMFSGKTEELIRRIRRAQIAKLNVAVFKPKVDTRYIPDKITSHNKLSFNAIVVSDSKQLKSEFEKLENIQVVCIDECQFFDEGIICVVEKIANMGVRVILAGLDLDFNQNGFGSMPMLLSKAESVTKLQAVCMDCGDLASYSYRTTQDKDQVVLGYQDIYTALCRQCYNKKRNKT